MKKSRKGIKRITLFILIILALSVFQIFNFFYWRKTTLIFPAFKHDSQGRRMRTLKSPAL